MKSSSVKIWFALSVAFFLASIAGFAFLYFNLDQKNLSLKEEMSRWEKEATHRANLKSLASFLESSKEELTAFDTHFITSLDVVPFLDYLESAGGSVGVSPVVSAVEISPNKSMLLVDVKTTGSFEDIYRFTTLVENSPFEVEVLLANLADTNVSTEGQGPSEWTGAFTLGLKSFINKEQENEI